MLLGRIAGRPIGPVYPAWRRVVGDSGRFRVMLRRDCRSCGSGISPSPDFSPLPVPARRTASTSAMVFCILHCRLNPQTGHFSTVRKITVVVVASSRRKFREICGGWKPPLPDIRHLFYLSILRIGTENKPAFEHTSTTRKRESCDGPT